MGRSGSKAISTFDAISVWRVRRDVAWVVIMDVPNLVIDLRQLRNDARHGRVSIEQLLDLIERQQQTIQRVQADRLRLTQRLAQYEPEAARESKTPAANAANANASYSVDAETKRRSPSWKAS